MKWNVQGHWIMIKRWRRRKISWSDECLLEGYWKKKKKCESRLERPTHIFCDCRGKANPNEPTLNFILLKVLSSEKSTSSTSFINPSSQMNDGQTNRRITFDVKIAKLSSSYFLLSPFFRFDAPHRKSFVGCCCSLSIACLLLPFPSWSDRGDLYGRFCSSFG